jgi:hypothetical protein
MQATKQRIRIGINEVRIDDLPGKDHGDDHGINGRAFTVEQATDLLTRCDRTMPPSTSSAAPVVADACGEQT